MGCTRIHLHNRVKGHKKGILRRCQTLRNMHETMPQGLLKRFEVLEKFRNKSDCLVYEMLFIRALKPNLDVQSDSIRAKVFVNFSSQNRFKCCNLHGLIICKILFIFSLIMESCLRRNVAFYRLFFTFFFYFKKFLPIRTDW